MYIKAFSKEIKNRYANIINNNYFYNLTNKFK